ncbi:hypothetical protein PROFUN_05692 [Planoprotostelium fungivorum]|uniref:Sas10 C-terminal domain-containing protein n=1 Tax=Planoprotostelium fungivorum TaxID=1890364 RepID=A0A2P6NQE0_9EUKA|nr:hypothetical protein PROFUN_05692 [Planoprotostelium fungivorum]
MVNNKSDRTQKFNAVQRRMTTQKKSGSRGGDDQDGVFSKGDKFLRKKTNEIVKAVRREAPTEDEEIEFMPLRVGRSFVEEEEEEEEEDVRPKGKNNKRQPVEEEEEEDDDDEDDGDDGGLLGKREEDFYNDDGSDAVGSSDEEEAGEEELDELRRLEKSRAKAMSEEDFGDDSFASQLKGKGKKSSRSADSDESVLEKFNKGLQAIGLEEAETIQKDLSGLTTDQKMQIIKRESPELLEFLEDFKMNIDEINENLQPILEKVSKGGLPTSSGVSLLDVKLHLLLSYSTQICFYMLLKAEGKSVQDHPVIPQLIKVRTLLEKAKPLDAKIKYQVDKLLKMSSAGSVQSLKNDPRRFKPNVADMEGEEEEEEEEEGEKDAVYRAPQVIPQYYMDSNDRAGKANQERRQLDRINRTSIMKEIRQGLSDMPVEEANIGAIAGDVSRELDEIDRYEEDNFKRVDSRIKKAARDKALKKMEQTRLEDGIGSFDKFIGMAKKKVEEPEEDVRKTAQKRSLKELLASKGMQDEEEDEYYQHAGNDGEYDEEAETFKRGLTKAIEGNRGLTRSRPRDNTHSRTKLRNKFEKAVSRRKGSVRDVRSQDKPYTGERSINANKRARK